MHKDRCLPVESEPSEWPLDSGQAGSGDRHVAAIPQQADTKWLNQFKATVTKSSGDSRQTHRGHEGEGSKQGEGGFEE